MERSNVEVMRVATQLEAMRRGLGVDPGRADSVRRQGRDGFYEAFWGRYGLPGNTMSRPIETVVGDDERFDLTNMSVSDVIALAQDLMASGRVGDREGALLGFDFDGLSFARDRAFRTSPLAILQGRFSQNPDLDRTFDWLNEYQGQLQHLRDNNAAPSAIAGTRNILDELGRLQTEQNMYWAMGYYRDGSERESGGLLSGGLVAPSVLTALMDR